MKKKEDEVKFASASKVRKVGARLIGGDICPVCGQLVVPYEDEGFWRMECSNPKCFACANIESDLWDTKKAARAAYRRAISLFVNLNKVTCHCDKCKGEVKELVFYKMLAAHYALSCVNCGNSVNEETEAECIGEWNEKNHAEADTAFRSFWKSRIKYEAGLNKYLDELENAKKVKHRG